MGMKKQRGALVLGLLIAGVTAFTPVASANAGPEPAPEPTLVQTIKGPSGATTLVYDDGATFTSLSEPQLQTRASGGSFAWDATFDTSVFSRHWTTSATGAIAIKVTKVSNCGYNNTLLLRKKEWYGFRYYGNTRSVPCSGGSYRWPDTPKDTYQFQLDEGGSSGDSYFSHKASGSVSYK